MASLMKLPKKIDPCPITEVIFEVRFDSALPGDAIFGIVFNKFKEDFPNVERLPILQLPEAIRSSDPQLIFSPHYKMQQDNFLLQIGPKVFSVVNTNEYSGWTQYSDQIYICFEELQKLGVIKQILRIGLRYINVFRDINIFEKSNLQMNLKEQSLSKNHINMSCEIPAGDYINTLKIISGAELLVGQKKMKGSVIDIDTVFVKQFENFKDTAEHAHTEEKKLFYSLLSDDFLKTLNPEY